jgi:NAD(P)-dependent dehydrogenase (short-subunit alcohol dehydrogenase family)
MNGFDKDALRGRTAVVTGAAGGLGSAIMAQLCAMGANIVALDLERMPLDLEGNHLSLACDITQGDKVAQAAQQVAERYGRCDILVNNAGLNILDRQWAKLTPDDARLVIDGNLSSAFYCSSAVLPMMRKRKDGVLIHTSSMAGRNPSTLSGAAYSAAKHGVVAMSHTINMEECVNGIRSCVVCPGEVATPILDKRPIPITKEERARMAQSEDVGDLIRYVACLPAHIVINEVMINPTWNRGYVGALQRAADEKKAKARK